MFWGLVSQAQSMDSEICGMAKNGCTAGRIRDGTAGSVLTWSAVKRMFQIGAALNRAGSRLIARDSKCTSAIGHTELKNREMLPRVGRLPAWTESLKVIHHERWHPTQ
jgi:hypothetical protein